MSLAEILPPLREGRKVRRAAWAASYYIYIDSRYPDKIIYMNFDDRLRDADILANDWEVAQ